MIGCFGRVPRPSSKHNENSETDGQEGTQRNANANSRLRSCREPRRRTRSCCCTGTARSSRANRRCRYTDTRSIVDTTCAIPALTSSTTVRTVPSAIPTLATAIPKYASQTCILLLRRAPTSPIKTDMSEIRVAGSKVRLATSTAVGRVAAAERIAGAAVSPLRT